MIFFKNVLYLLSSLVNRKFKKGGRKTSKGIYSLLERDFSEGFMLGFSFGHFPIRSHFHCFYNHNSRKSILDIDLLSKWNHESMMQNLDDLLSCHLLLKLQEILWLDFHYAQSCLFTNESFIQLFVMISISHYKIDTMLCI